MQLQRDFDQILGRPSKKGFSARHITLIKRVINKIKYYIFFLAQAQIIHRRKNDYLHIFFNFESTIPFQKHDMSFAMRKQVFLICENKDADQLRGNREADQRLCFRYKDGTIPLLPKYEISIL